MIGAAYDAIKASIRTSKIFKPKNILRIEWSYLSIYDKCSIANILLRNHLIKNKVNCYGICGDIEPVSIKKFGVNEHGNQIIGATDHDFYSSVIIDDNNLKNMCGVK